MIGSFYTNVIQTFARSGHFGHALSAGCGDPAGVGVTSPTNHSWTGLERHTFPVLATEGISGWTVSTCRALFRLCSRDLYLAIPDGGALVLALGALQFDLADSPSSQMTLDVIHLIGLQGTILSCYQPHQHLSSSLPSSPSFLIFSSASGCSVEVYFFWFTLTRLFGWGESYSTCFHHHPFILIRVSGEAGTGCFFRFTKTRVLCVCVCC